MSASANPIRYLIAPFPTWKRTSVVPAGRRCNSSGGNCAHCDHSRPHICHEPEGTCMQGNASSHTRANVYCEELNLTVPTAKARHKLEQVISDAQYNLEEARDQAQSDYDDAIDRADEEYEAAVSDVEWYDCLAWSVSGQS